MSAIRHCRSCGERDLPFFEIENNELLPVKLRPGGEFTHRLVYALCPERPTGVVFGRLAIRILFRGEAAHTETDRRYELRPGRWRVDTFVELPPDAEPGVYAYELDFTSKEIRFVERATFLVEP